MTTNVYLDRVFNCSAQELFKWLSQPDLFAQWFGPKHLTIGKVTINFQVSGTYQIELKKENGNSFYIRGTYEEIQEPIKIVFNLKYEGILNPPPNSTVKLLLTQTDAGTTKLSLIQKFETRPPDMEKRTKAWEFMFSRLGFLINPVEK